MQYSKEQIIAHRIHWAEYLQQPHLKKHKNALENFYESQERCCLGHGCAAFELLREVKSQDVFYEGNGVVAPNSLINLVGLYTRAGDFRIGRQSLASINDYGDATPQEIGVMLESWIEGGPNTPFVSLNEYN